MQIFFLQFIIESVINVPIPFHFTIPRDTSQPLPMFELMENTDSRYIINETQNQALNLLKLNGFITPKNNVSIHYHIKPNNNNDTNNNNNNDSFNSVGYFAALKFGGNPYLNSTFQSFDMWNIFCPQGYINSFTFFFK